jgi:hypothetical protein
MIKTNINGGIGQLQDYGKHRFFLNPILFMPFLSNFVDKTPIIINKTEISGGLRTNTNYGKHRFVLNPQWLMPYRTFVEYSTLGDVIHERVNLF